MTSASVPHPKQGFHLLVPRSAAALGTHVVSWESSSASVFESMWTGDYGERNRPDLRTRSHYFHTVVLFPYHAKPCDGGVFSLSVVFWCRFAAVRPSRNGSSLGALCRRHTPPRARQTSRTEMLKNFKGSTNHNGRIVACRAMGEPQAGRGHHRSGRRLQVCGVVSMLLSVFLFSFGGQGGPSDDETGCPQWILRRGRGVCVCAQVSACRSRFTADLASLQCLDGGTCRVFAGPGYKARGVLLCPPKYRAFSHGIRIHRRGQLSSASSHVIKHGCKGVWQHLFPPQGAATLYLATSVSSASAMFVWCSPVPVPSIHAGVLSSATITLSLRQAALYRKLHKITHPHKKPHPPENTTPR